MLGINLEQKQTIRTLELNEQEAPNLIEITL